LFRGCSLRLFRGCSLRLFRGCSLRLFRGCSLRLFRGCSLRLFRGCSLRLFRGCSYGLFRGCSLRLFRGCSYGLFRGCSLRLFRGCSLRLFRGCSLRLFKNTLFSHKGLFLPVHNEINITRSLSRMLGLCEKQIIGFGEPCSKYMLWDGYYNTLCQLKTFWDLTCEQKLVIKSITKLVLKTMSCNIYVYRNQAKEIQMLNCLYFQYPILHITRFIFKTFVDSVQNVCAIFVPNSFNSVAPRDRWVPSPTPSSLVREVIRLARTFCS